MILGLFRAAVAVVAFSSAILISSHLSAQERRIAFVLGNDTYQSVAKLRKAVNDAKLVARSLAESGFEVELLLDATLSTTLSAISKTAQRLRPGDFFLMYYAGHGVQVQGENFLIPIDANMRSMQELRDGSISISKFFEQVRAAQPAVSVWVFDACRDNPLASVKTRSIVPSSFKNREQPSDSYLSEPTSLSENGGELTQDHLVKTLSDSRGRMQSLTFFSAGSGGCPSETNPGPVTVFAKALADQIRQGGEIEEATRAIRREVERQTDGQQVPQIYSDLTGDVKFKGR